MSKLQNKIDKLQALLEASKLLNSSRNTNEILNFLLKKSLELIEGGDTGVIFIYNKGIKMLEMKSFAGLDNCVSEVKLLPDESMTGLSFTNKKTIFFNNAGKIRQAMNNMSKENVKILEKSLKNTIGKTVIFGTICCPLMYKEECIGVVVIDSFKNYAALTADDVTLLEAISVQATIAIINAQNYEKEQRNNKVMAKYSRMLEEEKNRYQYSSNLHTKFTEMVLNGSNVGDILFEVANLLKRDIFMIDLFYNINCYNFNYYTDLETIIKLSDDFIIHLSNTKETEYFCPDMKLHLHFSPIMVNVDILGWLCIVSDNNLYSKLNKITIESGSTIIALQLLKINELSDMEQSLKGDFLDNLILNQNNEYLMRCAKNYKFNFAKNHQIIIMEIQKKENYNDHETGDMELKRYVKYYYDSISEAASKTFYNSIELIKGNDIIIIIEENENNKKKIKKLLDKMMIINNKYYTNLHNKVRLRAGVSDIIHNTDNFKSAYFNTQQIIRTLDNAEGENLYLFYDDLEIKKLLLNNTREDLEQFFLKTLGPLIDFQSDSNEYFDTLKIYIQSNGNWTYTKNQLHIHGNTLSYRLNRIMSILNTDIKDYDERLKIQIAFVIYDILPLSNLHLDKP